MATKSKNGCLSHVACTKATTFEHRGLQPLQLLTIKCSMYTVCGFVTSEAGLPCEVHKRTPYNETKTCEFILYTEKVQRLLLSLSPRSGRTCEVASSNWRRQIAKSTGGPNLYTGSALSCFHGTDCRPSNCTMKTTAQ